MSWAQAPMIPGGPVNAGSNAFQVLQPLIGQGPANLAGQLLGPHLSNYLGNPTGNIGMTHGMGHYYGNTPYEVSGRLGQVAQDAQLQGYSNLVGNFTKALGHQYAGAEQTVGGLMQFAHGMGVPMPNLQGGNPQDLASSVERAIPNLMSTNRQRVGGEQTTWEWLTGKDRAKVYDYTANADDAETYFKSVHRNMVDDKGAVNQEYARGFDMSEVGTMMEEMARQGAYNPYQGGGSAEENISKQTGETIKLMESMKEAFGNPDSSIFELIDTMDDLFGDNSLVRVGAEKMTKIVQEMDATRIQLGMSADELRGIQQKGAAIAARYGNGKLTGTQSTQQALNDWALVAEQRKQAQADGTYNKYAPQMSKEEFIENRQRTYNSGRNSVAGEELGSAQVALTHMNEDLGREWLWGVFETGKTKEKRNLAKEIQAAKDSGNVEKMREAWRKVQDSDLFTDTEKARFRDNSETGLNQLDAEKSDLVGNIYDAGTQKAVDSGLSYALSSRDSDFNRSGHARAFEGLRESDIQDLVLGVGGDQLLNGTEAGQRQAAGKVAKELAKRKDPGLTNGGWLGYGADWGKKWRYETKAGDLDWKTHSWSDFDNFWDLGLNLRNQVKKAWGWFGTNAEEEEAIDDETVGIRGAGDIIKKAALESGGQAGLQALINKKNMSPEALERLNESQKFGWWNTGGHGAAKNWENEIAEKYGARELGVAADKYGSATIMGALANEWVTAGTTKAMDWSKITGGAVKMSEEDLGSLWGESEEMRNAAGDMNITNSDDMYKAAQLNNEYNMIKEAADRMSADEGIGNFTDQQKQMYDAMQDRMRELQTLSDESGFNMTLGDDATVTGMNEINRMSGGSLGAGDVNGSIIGENRAAREAAAPKQAKAADLAKDIKERRARAKRAYSEAQDDGVGKEASKLSYIVGMRDSAYGGDGKELTEEERKKQRRELQKEALSGVVSGEALDAAYEDDAAELARDSVWDTRGEDQRTEDIMARVMGGMTDEQKKELNNRLAGQMKEARVENEAAAKEADAAAKDSTLVDEEVDYKKAYSGMFTASSGSYTMGERLGGDVARSSTGFFGSGGVREVSVSPAIEAASAVSAKAQGEALQASMPEPPKVVETGAGTGKGAGTPMDLTGSVDFESDTRRGRDTYELKATLIKKGAG